MISRLLVRATVLWVLIAAVRPAWAARVELAHPPMGWNSFDSYGAYLTEEAARANLEAMAVKLKPFGYEFFVIDNGWAGEYDRVPGTPFSREKHAARLNLDAHGYFEPSHVSFPHGFGPLIARCHELGLKFGVHLMRGIPRQAVEQNLPVEGTPFHARDIADTAPSHQCAWCPYNYGVDMAKPGAQAWYDGLIRHLAAAGVDFIKYDDIVPYPREIDAVAAAIARVGRPIVLSLSPGGHVDPGAIASFQRANLLRVTSDIWDTQAGIDRCFAAWQKWSTQDHPGLWIDMDMIPFGQLQLMSPPRGEAAGETAETVALTGRGTTRWSELAPDQMRTFITLRALAASPLFVGGDLPSLDAFSLQLVTDPDVIACDQNGIMGRLRRAEDGLEIWFTPDRRRAGAGWIGIFNRTSRAGKMMLTPATLGLALDAHVVDIWHGRRELNLVAPATSVTIPANGVLFLGTHDTVSAVPQ